MTLLAGEAGAHAVPVTMDPAPNARLLESPREVVVRFSERVEARPSTLEVLDARGRRVDTGEAAVDPADPWRYRVGIPLLPTGAYTVSWRVLSADDGHVTHGAHVFTVGGAVAPSAASGPAVSSGAGWRPVARWMVALGGALLLGAAVAGRLLRLGGTAPSPGMEVFGGAVVAIGGTLDLVLQARELAGSRPMLEMLATLLGVTPGRVWLLRAGLLLLLAAVWARDRGRERGEAVRRWILLGLAAAVVMTGALVSHVAAALEGRWLLLGIEAVHLLAMASWVGGVLGFATVFWRAGSERRPDHEAARLALAIPVFSGLAVLAVGTLAVSGVVLARLHLTTWAELLGTGYGRWLVAKLVVFLAMLGFGAWHQGWLGPSLLRAVQAGEGTPAAVSRFRRSIRLEAGLGLVVLALAGVLGVAAPPSPSAPSTDQPASTTFRHERAFDEAHVRLEIAPLRPGPNTIRLIVTDHAGRALGDATGAMVQVTPVDASVGAVTFQLDRASPGEFVAPSAVFGLVGRWNGRLVVQRSGAYDVNDRFELTVPEGSAAPAHGAPSGPVRRASPFDRITGLTALVTAAIVVLLLLRNRRRLSTVRRLLTETSEQPALAPAPR